MMRKNRPLRLQRSQHRIGEAIDSLNEASRSVVEAIDLLRGLAGDATLDGLSSGIDELDDILACVNEARGHASKAVRRIGEWASREPPVERMSKHEAVKRSQREIKTERYDTNLYVIKTYMPEHDDYDHSAPMSWGVSQIELTRRRLRRCLELMGKDPNLAERAPGQGKLSQRLAIITMGAANGDD